jgi:hypothetical protein
MLKHINYKLVVTCAVAVLMLGCAKSIEVLAEFPEPVLVPLPLAMGIRYPTDLTDFTYTEDPELSPEWTIKLGQANLRMFRALFKGMFTKTVELKPEPALELTAELSDEAADESSDESSDQMTDQPTNEPANVTTSELTATQSDPDTDPSFALDAIIEPRLEELEFSTPEQSGNDQFTVWLRYTIRITTPEGELITDWRVTGYGQADEGSMGMGDETAMRKAAITALRDVAANIATSFSSLPAIKTTLLPPATPFMEGTGFFETS